MKKVLYKCKHIGNFYDTEGAYRDFFSRSSVIFLREFASNKKTSKSNHYERTLVCLFNHCSGSLSAVIGVRKI